MGCAWNCLPVDMLTAKMRGWSWGDSSPTVLFSTCLATTSHKYILRRSENDACLMLLNTTLSADGIQRAAHMTKKAVLNVYFNHKRLNRSLTQHATMS